MATAVLMPQVGENIETAIITAWMKRAKDSVAQGEVVCTVEAEKVTLEVEAPASGVMLKLLYKEGEDAPVLKPIAYIGQPGESLP
jgi:pyruvate dehydrogenase E2 component (dihydrolipoamide acetyltransferase)